MTSIIFLNQLLPKNYKVLEFNIRFYKPIYPEDELFGDLEIKSNHEFEFNVSN